jgi:dihydropteroate synthase
MKYLKVGSKKFLLGKKTLIMGILNVTPDSFSDGGRHFSVDAAINHAIKLEENGADIIDIGGESTRPGSQSISSKEEIKRVKPIIENLADRLSIPMSIDTYKSEVAEKAIDFGVGMVNDITALQGDHGLVGIITKHDVPVCLMHMKGSPLTMQKNPKYEDVVGEIRAFLKERADFAIFYDVKKENIILDPGIGFGKRTGRGVEDNCEILKKLSELKSLGFPILVGPSRKTFIGNVCGGKKQLPVNDRLEGSLAAACIAAINGADIVRVHDVKETRRCLDLINCVIN